MSTNSGISAVGRKTSSMPGSQITSLSEDSPIDDNNGIGVIIVDHGSRRADANRRHEHFVANWREHSRFEIVEPAHMEFAQPSIRTAFDSCVAAGATKVMVLPLFLWPGVHLERDVPLLAAEAASRHPSVAYVVGPPLGAHPLLIQIVDDHLASSTERLDRTAGP